MQVDVVFLGLREKQQLVSGFWDRGTSKSKRKHVRCCGEKNE
jgi:hypothetical protein